MEQQTAQTFQLPLGVVNKVDVGRLLREIDALNTFMRSAEVRQPGTSVPLPKTSKLLDEFLEVNKKSALKSEDRDEVTKFLNELRMHSPSIHVSFSADPSPLFTQRLVSWLRQNIHPSLLLQVGLQPTIGAGAIVRTTNKYFDLSLRKFFDQKKSVLLAKMQSAEAEEPTEAPAAPQPDAALQSTPAQAELPPHPNPAPQATPQTPEVPQSQPTPIDERAPEETQ